MKAMLGATVCVLALVVPGVAAAGTIYVDDDNTSSPWNGTQEDPYQYIGEALYAASDGDTILIMPGTYQGEDPEDPYGIRKNRDMDISNKTITLTGSSPTDPEVVAETVIDCEGNESEPHSAFGIYTADVTIRGLTLKKGYRDFYGGSIAFSGGDLAVENCVFLSNAAADGGGALYLDGDVQITGCQFEENAAGGNGGAVYCDGGTLTMTNCTLRLSSGGGDWPWAAALYAQCDSVEIQNCSITESSGSSWAAVYLQGDIAVRGSTISDNSMAGLDVGQCTGIVQDCAVNRNADTGWRGGGGISICTNSEFAGGLTVQGCEIRGNSTATGGGGIAIVTPGGPLDASTIVKECVVADNTAAGGGGGIYVLGPSLPAHPVIIESCTITGNQAPAWGGIGLGFRYEGYLTITDCLIAENTATGDGSGPYGDGCGGGIGTYTLVRTEIVNCVIRDNEANVSGGGLWYMYAGPAMKNCLVFGNTAITCGGGVDAYWAIPDDHTEPELELPARLDNCTLTQNKAGWGAGFYAGYGGDPPLPIPTRAVIDSSIVWGNVLWSMVAHDIAYQYDIEEDWTCSPTVTYSDVGEPLYPPENGNIWSDPLFIPGGLHSYYLSQTAAGQGGNSPCLNAGSDTAENLHLDDRTTRTDGVFDTDMVDMGYHAPVYIDITDVHWDQEQTSVVITFSSENGVAYDVQAVDADKYSGSLLWTASASETASDDSTTVTDNLTGNGLTADYRFYRIKRQDRSEYSRQTVGVFELSLSSVPQTKFIGVPLIPDPDHDSTREIFGEKIGAADNRQVARSGFQVSDLNEATGGVSRMRLVLDGADMKFSVIAGDEFDIGTCAGYEIVMGLGAPATYTVRLTGYVPEAPAEMSLTKTGAQSLRWTAYSMPRPTTLAGLGLETAVTPWNALNKVRLLPSGSSAWSNYQYDTQGGYWYDTDVPGEPADPDILCGMGIVFIRGGPADADDSLKLPTWYVHPPNVW